MGRYQNFEDTRRERCKLVKKILLKDGLVSSGREMGELKVIRLSEISLEEKRYCWTKETDKQA